MELEKNGWVVLIKTGTDEVLSYPEIHLTLQSISLQGNFASKGRYILFALFRMRIGAVVIIFLYMD